jgi:glycosyltransferase involved in cell wall biosynthesis
MKRMNVFVDGRWGGNTGIGRVYKEVISRKPDNVNLNILNTNFGLGNPLGPIHLAKEIYKTKGNDVFYSPSFMPPLTSNIPFVTTLHDVNHLYYYSIFHKLYLKHVIRYLSLKAKKIITVSNYSKQEIVEQLSIPADQIEVIYNGLDNSFALNNQRASFNRPYFFYIGNRRKFKNVIKMMQAFSKAAIPDDFILVLSGNIDAQLTIEINLLGIADRIKFLGDISNEDLPAIYKGAHALLFVPLREGFGLPIIEAMASGTPVITSNVSSLPEVAGGAALLVDPLDIDSIADGIEQLVYKKELQAKLIELGQQRSIIFNWNDTAAQTWDVIMK